MDVTSPQRPNDTAQRKRHGEETISQAIDALLAKDARVLLIHRGYHVPDLGHQRRGAKCQGGAQNRQQEPQEHLMLDGIVGDEAETDQRWHGDDETGRNGPFDAVLVQQPADDGRDEAGPKMARKRRPACVEFQWKADCTNSARTASKPIMIPASVTMP